MTTQKATDPDQQVNFEQAMQELEGIIRELESGDLSLESSLAKFERAVALTRLSQAKLASAEQKVQQLLQQNGDEKLVDATASDDGLPF
ncbi:MAG: exodeoxyribonuclease VII small subunit [Firmicutes bacterium]|nr:exodeoxyribonuclease VII small subunit [Bacillota bacterium]